MQAVLLAAGKSSRFYPYSHLHKSLIRIMGRTILEHTLRSVKKAGITDVIVVVGKDSPVREIIGNGKNLGLKITFVVQSEAQGMGDALLQASSYITQDFYLLHAHHADFKELKTLIDLKRKTGKEVILLAQHEKELGRFGVLKVEGDKVLDLLEKPQKGEEFSNLKVIGIYLLNKEFLKVLSTVPLDHYNFEKALSCYVQTQEVRVAVVGYSAITLKYPWDLLTIKNYFLRNIKRYISKSADISEYARITGNVVIEEGARIFDGASIKGPCYIGKNVMIGSNALIRDGSCIEEGSKIGAYMEIRGTHFMKNSSTHSGFIGDSIIGENCKIGALFCTSNVRLDRENIKVIVGENKIDTGLHSLGVVLGNNARIGTHSNTMPGIIIGKNVIIGPSTVVLKNILDDTRYFTKFIETTEEKIHERTDKKNALVLFDIDYTLFNTALFKESNLIDFQVYDDVSQSLKDVKQLAEIGIFSEGDKEFQYNKLKNTRLLPLFSEKHIHVFEKKKDFLKEIIKESKHSLIVLVDDKIEILAFAKEINPSIKTIWIKRGPFALNPSVQFTADLEIDTLRDISYYIKEKLNKSVV